MPAIVREAKRNRRVVSVSVFLLASVLLGGGGTLLSKRASAGACVCTCAPYCVWWGPCLCEIWSPEALDGWAVYSDTVTQSINDSDQLIEDAIKRFAKDMAAARGKNQESINKAMANGKNYAENKTAVSTEKPNETAQRYLAGRVGYEDTKFSASTAGSINVSAAKIGETVGNATRAEVENLLSWVSNEPIDNAAYAFNTHAARYCDHVDMLRGDCASVEPSMRSADLVAPVFLKDSDGEADSSVMGEDRAEAGRTWVFHVVGASRMPNASSNPRSIDTGDKKAFEQINVFRHADVSVYGGAMLAALRRRTQNIVAFDGGSASPTGNAGSVEDALAHNNPALGNGTSYDIGTSPAGLCTGKGPINATAFGDATTNSAIDSAYAANNLSTLGVDRDGFHMYAYKESTKRPRAGSGTSSPYKGLFQLHQTTVFSGECGMSGDIYDPSNNAACGAKFAQKNAGYLAGMGLKIHGVSPALVLYMAHQQGAGGFSKIYKYVLSGQEPPPGDPIRIALARNLPGKADPATITVKQWWNYWKAQFGC